MRTLWFISLICAVCLEGLGRRYLPAVPSAVFYFLKDVVLLVGWFRFRPTAATNGTARYLYRGFGIFCMVGFVFTLAQVFNPEQGSMVLGFIGLRSYWLWFIAPPVIATVLQSRKEKERAIYALLAVCIGVSGLAAVQFASPPDSSVNMYSVWNGAEVYAADSAIVASTGRARVASTFSYLTGFTDFTILVPTLLLSLGLDTEKLRVRRAALIGTFVTAAVVPMSGSRSSVVFGVVTLGLTLWVAGLFFTRIGRRVLVGGVVAGALSVLAFPTALEGVQSRFENTEETSSRFQELANLLPPVAMVTQEYPMLGLGTGMQQNARFTLRVGAKWNAEAEVGRYLIELGPLGFILVWLTKLGLAAALFRAYKFLKRVGRRGSAGAALSYAVLTMVGSLAFDHTWQALYFIGCGFILAEVVAARQRLAAVEVPAAVVAPVTVRVRSAAA
jgi:hypothetical protein